MKEKLKQEVIGVLFMITAILTGISLATYSPSDVLSMSRFFLIENAMGIAGVFISHVLIKYVLGYFSWGLVLLLFVWGWTFFAAKDYRKTWRFTLYWFCFILLTALLTTTILNRHVPIVTPDFNISGFIGGSLSIFLMDWLGLIPSILILAVAIIVVVSLYFRWSMYQPLNRLWKRWMEKYHTWKTTRKERKLKEKNAEAQEKGKTEKKKEKKRKKTSIKVLPAEPEPVEDQKPGMEGNDIPDISPQKKKPERDEKKDKKSTDDQSSYDFEVSEKRTDDSIDYDDFVEEGKKREYHFPSVDLLNDPPPGYEIDPNELQENADILTKTLADFGVTGKVVKVVPGPVVTLYEVEPATGVRVSKISSLADDIARVMAAKRIRIIAPIPGKKVVGVEIPNRKPEIVYFKSIVKNPSVSTHYSCPYYTGLNRLKSNSF
ncbi:MAG: DNA segregation ATPase FtsK [Marinimicrobia bacterium 46_43]|nr:MAG: DNA segregation ATPase FtsK [Marinimicrobia bacterium 46_43]